MIWSPDIAAAHRQWASVAGNWDDEFGWPSPRDAVAPPRDHTGAKFNANFPQAEHTCASAYGDSFIWGDDIPLSDGWIEQLSRKLGCQVSNYGVSSYATDQAYLRFTRMTRDDAPVVLLGIFLENIMRNVNQYRAFIGFTQDLHWLKGRFVLDRASSFRARAKFGEPEYAPLLTALAARHVDVFDPSAALLAATGQRNYCDLYVLPADCTGHFGVFGSRLVADVVLTELRRPRSDQMIGGRRDSHLFAMPMARPYMFARQHESD